MGIVTVGKPTCSGEYFSSYISKFHCWFLQFQICLAKELGRDSTSTWRMQQKVAMTTFSKAGHFWHQYALLADWKRIFLFLKCCTVQIRDSVSFWGPKAFSFGRCDQELRTKCRKMVKNESAQNWFESKKLDRARFPDSGAVNGSENGRRMRKLCQKQIAQ